LIRGVFLYASQFTSTAVKYSSIAVGMAVDTFCSTVSVTSCSRSVGTLSSIIFITSFIVNPGTTVPPPPPPPGVSGGAIGNAKALYPILKLV
jgi:hypothetical protein